jgi:glycosyltransferase involved in cell wall biosynthesis
VSVVTVTRNCARTLEACLDSVAAQTLLGIEHLVVDGGSMDGTVELLRARNERVAWWTSEPDRGIYDAMNKGVAQARGAWIYFLGADDVLAAPDVLERIEGKLRHGPAVVYGDVRFTNGHRFRSAAGRKLLVGNTIHHQGAFYAARVFDGWRFDAALRIAADYELNLRLYRAGERFDRADVVVAECGDEGASNARLGESYREMNQVRRRYVSAPVSGALALVLGAEVGAYRLLRSVRRATSRRGA